MLLRLGAQSNVQRSSSKKLCSATLHAVSLNSASPFFVRGSAWVRTNTYIYIYSMFAQPASGASRSSDVSRHSAAAAQEHSKTRVNLNPLHRCRKCCFWHQNPLHRCRKSVAQVSHMVLLAPKSAAQVSQMLILAQNPLHRCRKSIAQVSQMLI